jgi:hypothetical protein
MQIQLILSDPTSPVAPLITEQSIQVVPNMKIEGEDVSQMQVFVLAFHLYPLIQEHEVD